MPHLKPKRPPRVGKNIGSPFPNKKVVRITKSPRTPGPHPARPLLERKLPLSRELFEYARQAPKAPIATEVGPRPPNWIGPWPPQVPRSGAGEPVPPLSRRTGRPETRIPEGAIASRRPPPTKGASEKGGFQTPDEIAAAREEDKMKGRLGVGLRILTHWRDFKDILDSLMSVVDETDKALADGKFTLTEQRSIMGRLIDLLANLRRLTTGAKD